MGALFTLALVVGLSMAGDSAEARFPGVNGRIACEGGRGAAAPVGGSRQEIFTINPDGTDEVRLTTNTVTDIDPVYSPDGKRIAFASTRTGTTQIFVGNADGDLNGPDVIQLTDSPGGHRQPSWSPDGTQLVFHSGRPAEFPAPIGTVNDFEIYKMSATTGEAGGVQRLTTNRGQDAIPAWSPDGSRIAFQTLREATPATNEDLEIYTMNPDGSDQRNVSNWHGTPNDPATPGNEATNGQDSTPSWSPDGQRLAWASSRDNVTPGNRNYEIYRATREGGDQTRLTLNLSGDTPDEGRDFDHVPSWSPDGKRMIFHSDRTQQVVAYTMDSTVGEAGGLQRLAPTGAFAKCDWQSLRPAAAPPAPSPTPTPPAQPAAFEDCPATTANVIRGASAANTITGTPAGDRIFGGTGNDVVDALAGNDCVDTGTGDDRAQGGLGDDLLLAGIGNDRMSGSSGRDRLRGNPGNDRLDGGRGNDSLFGDAGNDTLLGSFGNDRLHGVSGKDVITGSRGRDRINGGAGNDRIAGGSSADKIAGDAGSDRINGNSGSDRIKGNSGSDRITSRDNSRDRVNCGLGRDSVVADRKDVVSRNCERVRRR